AHSGTPMPGPSNGPVVVDITRIRTLPFGRWGQNLPISNNFQQTLSARRGIGVHTFGESVIRLPSSAGPSRVSQNTKFLDNDFITASR
ncbi:MAG: hypothetical protein ACSLFA_14645, partial [Mycobacterium sp.]